VAGSSEHGNEPLVSMEGGKFSEQLSDYQLSKMHSVPWSDKLIIKVQAAEVYLFTCTMKHRNHSQEADDPDQNRSFINLQLPVQL
jgi:hypothetical protein